MPYRDEYVDPEEILYDEKTGLTVFRSYKDDNADQPLYYWYHITCDAYVTGEGVEFDIRDLSNYSTAMNKENHESILKEAIEQGFLTEEGINEDQ